MSALCPTSCTSIAALVESYFDCTDRLRRFGFNHFILVKCDYQFADLSDPVEWTAAITSGDVKISPPGELIIQPADATTFEIEGCGREFPGLASFNIDFTTYQTFDGAAAHTQNVESPEVPKDVDYWRNLFANSASYRLMMVECNSDRFYVDDAWLDAALARALGTDPITVADASPGFEFSITVIPGWVEGEEDFGQWSTQFRIKKAGAIEQLILPGVKAVLA